MNRRSLIAGAALAGLVPMGTRAACDATGERNKDTLMRYVTDVLNGGDVAVIDEIGHPEYASMDPGDAPGLDAWKQRIASSRETLLALVPDLTYEVQEMIAVEERVAMRGRIVGTSASGKVVDVLMLAFIEFRDGKMFKTWDLQDTEAFMAAL